MAVPADITTLTMVSDSILLTVAGFGVIAGIFLGTIHVLNTFKHPLSRIFLIPIASISYGAMGLMGGIGLGLVIGGAIKSLFSLFQ